jgi:hypothetical protein
VGGITGRNGNNNTAEEIGRILNCYNQGEIADNAATGTGQNAYGGITGWCDIVSTVKSCYTTGLIKQGGSAATSGNVNPIIGMVDSDPQNTDNNYSLNTIFASSTDVELTGTRKTTTYMQDEDFVNVDLNGGSTGPYVFVPENNYPKLDWE